MRLGFSLACAAFAVALVFAGARPASAQTISNQELQAYESLSPDQQQAIKQQLSGQLGLSQSNSAPTPLSAPITVVPRTLNFSSSSSDASAGGNTVVIESQTPTVKAPPSAEPDSEASPPSKGEDDPMLLTTQRPPPYGYDLFAGSPTTFAPATDIPVPLDYVLGPGDTVNVQLFGKTAATYTLQVGRDGTIQFPDDGPIAVAGLTYDEMKQAIEKKVAKTMIGVQASVTLGALRSMRIFVLGDAYRPGAYTVSSLSTVTNALFVSGGVNLTGTLRDIQLKRRGRIVQHLDLYDLLLRGDTSGDERLMPGDVVFIPPVGKRVSVDGQVVRPATYEIRGSTTVGGLLDLAGGLLPTAYLDAVDLERIESVIGRTVATLNLNSPAGKKKELDDGDFLRVYSVLDRAENVVLILGNVDRPGLRQWKSGMRLSDAIGSLSELKPRSDTGLVLIRREVGPSREIEVHAADLSAALRTPGGVDDIMLSSRDRIYVFPADGDRSELLQPLVEDLRKQATATQEAQVLQVEGRVKSPGDYPMVTGMSVTDLVRLAGGFTEDAYTREIEVVRRGVINGDKRQTTRFVVDMNQPATVDATELQPYDIVHVRPVEGWTDLEKVTISGEVRFPGSYAIAPNETMKSLITRAGGLTQLAYVPGATFTRESVRKAQQDALAQESQRLRNELAQVQIEASRDVTAKATDASKAAQVGSMLAKELESAQAQGRIVVDLQAVLDEKVDVSLRGGDTLSIPRMPSSVSVLGEVQYPTSHLFNAKLDAEDYIDSSGGFTRRADNKRAYVIHYNGEVVSLHNLKHMQPGDTIIVPFDAERIPQLSLWSTITEIVSRLAITAASFKTLGIF